MNIRSHRWLALVLWASAQMANAAEPPPATPATEQQLEAAMAVYAESAMETLAASEAPRERWIAGLMLMGEAMRGGGSGTDADAMRERAQKLLEGALAAGEDDPTLLFWAILDPPVRDSGDSDGLAAARLKLALQLQRLEPENAVVWIGALPPREAPGEIPNAIDLLHKAATATRFDTHFATSMRMLIEAFGRVPLPQAWPDTSALAGWEGVDRADVQVIMAVGVASSMAMPYLAALQSWCGNSDEQPWLDDCRALAQLMVDESDSIVPRSQDMALLASLNPPDSDAAKQAKALRRELAWVVENGLQRVGPGQPLSFGVWRSAWTQPGANELTVARAMVEAQGLPLSPPADFVPAWDR